MVIVIFDVLSAGERPCIIVEFTLGEKRNI